MFEKSSYFAHSLMCFLVPLKKTLYFVPSMHICLLSNTISIFQTSTMKSEFVSSSAWIIILFFDAIHAQSLVRETSKKL